ncbi:MAG TPA: metallophosphoesterase [Rectinemataceae bacterium]
MKPVKILCLADEVDLLVYSPSIKERFGDADLILSAGDLPEEYLGYVSAMLNRPMLSVAGNHDSDVHPASIRQPAHEGITPGDSCGLGRLRFSIAEEAGISVLGIPGCMRYSGGPNQFSELYMRLKVLSLAPLLLLRRLLTGRGVDIILAHSPPKGIGDAADLPHRGFSSFLWLIKLAKPVYFIHGHVHVYDARQGRELRLGDTLVVNVYGHRILKLEGAAR